VSEIEDRAGQARERVMLSRWDPRIKKAAARSAATAGLDPATAEDIAQECRIALLRSMRTGHESPSHLQTVLDTTIRKLHRDESRGFRARSGRLDFPGDELDDVGGWGEKPDASELCDIGTMIRLLANLPARFRPVFQVVYVDGQSHRAAARTLGLSRRAFGSLHGDFMAFLMAQLSPEPGRVAA